MILIRDNHRDERRARNPVNRVVNPIIHALFHALCFNARPLIVGHNRPRPGLKGIELALRVAGRRILMAAPVVEHLRNMADPGRALRAPENKIIILRPVKFMAKTAHTRRQIMAHHK